MQNNLCSNYRAAYEISLIELLIENIAALPVLFPGIDFTQYQGFLEKQSSYSRYIKQFIKNRIDTVFPGSTIVIDIVC